MTPTSPRSPNNTVSTADANVARGNARARTSCLCLPVPPLVVNAGAGGARLSIRLLSATRLVFSAGQAQVLHDPVGLTGERLLALIYQAIARPFNASRDRVLRSESGPDVCAVRWLEVQAPLSRVWAATDHLADRAWRPPRERPFTRRVAERVSERVAERVSERPSVRAAGQVPARMHDPGIVGAGPAEPAATAPASLAGILLLSESPRSDALSPHATARLVTRALKRGWSVFAVTREGPMADAGAPHRSTSHPSASPPSPDALAGPSNGAPPWRQHLVCRSGLLTPISR